jgi:hypothetical protein
MVLACCLQRPPLSALILVGDATLVVNERVRVASPLLSCRQVQGGGKGHTEE